MSSPRADGRTHFHVRQMVIRKFLMVCIAAIPGSGYQGSGPRGRGRGMASNASMVLQPSPLPRSDGKSQRIHRKCRTLAAPPRHFQRIALGISLCREPDTQPHAQCRVCMKSPCHQHELRPTLQLASVKRKVGERSYSRTPPPLIPSPIPHFSFT